MDTDVEEHEAGASHHSSLGVGRALRQASKLYNRQMQERLATHGLGLAEFLHLRELWLTDGLSQIELARRIGIEKASSTNVITSLEKKGVITRERNSTDRRIFNVFVTEAGQALKHCILPRARAVALQATANFSDRELKIFVEMLERISENLSEA